MEIRKRKSKKGILIGVVVIILLLAAGAGFVAYNYSLSKKKTAEVADNLSAGESSVKWLCGVSWDSLEDFNELDAENLSKQWTNQILEGAPIEGQDPIIDFTPADVRAKIDSARQTRKHLLDSAGDLALLAKIAKHAKLSESSLAEYGELATNGGTEFLRQFGNDMLDYAKKAQEFQDKYADFTGVEELKMQEDYGVLQNYGVELTEKYKEVNFKDITGVSCEEIDQMYEDARSVRDWAK